MAKRDYTFTDMVHAEMILLMSIMYDEYTTVNGIVFICDMSGLGLKNIPTSDWDNMRKWSQCWEV